METIYGESYYLITSILRQCNQDLNNGLAKKLGSRPRSFEDIKVCDPKAMTEAIALAISRLPEVQAAVQMQVELHAAEQEARGPIRVAILPVNENAGEHAWKVQQQLEQAGIRTELDGGNEKIGSKIRTQILSRTPYMLILGDREVETGTVSVRAFPDVKGNINGTMSVTSFIAACTRVDANRQRQSEILTKIAAQTAKSHGQQHP